MTFRSSVRARLLAAVACVAVLAPGGASVMAQQVPTVSQIRVEGNQRIERETVISYMAIAVGDPMESDRVDRSLKALFATGLFADVLIGQDGGALVVRVVENPVINRIVFEGNSSITDDVLISEVQLRPRVVFTRSRVQGDVQRLIQIYQRSGRFAVSVEPKVIELGQNRVDLVFEVNEGPKTGIRRIRFIGNQVFSDRQLRGPIQTKEARWWRWFTSGDVYDPDRLSFDQELLRNYYFSRGYADFRVSSAVAQLTPDGRDFFVTFTVEEGRRYQFGESKVMSNIPDLDPAFLKTLVREESGEIYNAAVVADTVLDLSFESGRLGYAFVDIRPLLSRDREAGVIDVTYEIAEGERIYVERIEITGNVRTLDSVLRREFRLSEGDAYNTAKIQRSIQRLHALGYFDSVDVNTEPAAAVELGPVGRQAEDRVNLNVDVRERSTGSLSFGVGYSSLDQFLTDVSIAERNLLGRGQSLRLSFSLASQNQQFDFSFTEPYFLGRPLAAGVDLFTVREDFEGTSSYSEARRGLGLRLDFPLAENLTASVRYGLRQVSIEDVAPTASRFVAQQEGTRIVSSATYSLFYDQRDDPQFPTEGYALRLSQELAGLGGSVRYLKTKLAEQAHFRTIREDWITILKMEAGFISGLGDDIAINNRFFIGGHEIRGFRLAGLGPRDANTGDALGGTVYYVASAELTFPLGLPEDIGIRGGVFIDVGSLGKLGFSDQDVNAVNNLRVTSGVGLTWISPLGPLRFDFTLPLKKESFDLTEQFRFSFQNRF
jgi:outer membrane protein insertion porin family